MVRKPNEWPERGELIVGTVLRVNPFSAFISLDEYGGKEGMIHISEVARKWIKDIKEFLKEGEKIVAVVMNVDEEKKHVTLSLKRVDKYDAEERMKEFKREQKAEKMLSMIAKERKISLDEAYKEVGFKLQEGFGEMFKGFQSSLTDQGYNILLRKGIPEDLARIIKEIAEKQMELKEIVIRGLLELRSPAPNGIEIIKKALLEAEKNNMEVKYISAPNYQLYLKTKDAKAGERKMKEISENIIKILESSGGEGSFKIG